MFLIHTEVGATVLDEHVHFFERTLIKQHGYTLAGCVLTLLVLLLNCFLAAAHTSFGTEFDKFSDFLLLFVHFC